MTNYKGIFPALITPFTKENRINESSLQKLVKMNLDKGVTGFYVGGSSGEAFLLSLDERKYILDIVVAEAKGKCTLISHIGCICTDDAIKLGKHAEKIGVDAISSIPPFYYKFSFSEIKKYYFDIVEEVNLPMIIYNFPALSGVELTADNIKELTANSRIIGIKHTSQNLYQVERMKSGNPNIIILNGHDEVFLGGLVMGADGAIGSTYNFMAEKFIIMKKLFEEGKIAEAQKIQRQANEIIAVLLKVGGRPGTKAILDMMGIECGHSRRPFKKITDEEREILKKVIGL